MSLGMAQSFGVMYSELKDQFGASKGETAWIQSLFGGFMLAMGPVAGVLVRRYGCRRVTMIGSLILALGLATSMAVESIHTLYVTFGIVGGFGASLMYIGASVIPQQHFDRRLGLAVSYACAGVGAGTMLIPLITHALLNAYGWRGTFLLLSGLALQGVVGGATFSPNPQQGKRKKTEVEVKADLRTSEKEEQHSVQTAKDKFSFKQYFGFVNPSYVAFVSSWTVCLLAYYIPFLVLPDVFLSKNSKNSKSESAWIGSALGIGNLIGRGAFGHLGDMKSVDNTLLHSLPIYLGGVMCLVVNFIDQFYAFVLVGIVIGMAFGVPSFILSIIMQEIVGLQDLSVAIGVFYFFVGVYGAVGPPIGGWISDSTGSYTETFYYCSALFFLSATLVWYITCKRCKSCHSKRAEYTQI